MPLSVYLTSHKWPQRVGTAVNRALTAVEAVLTGAKAKRPHRLEQTVMGSAFPTDYRLVHSSAPSRRTFRQGMVVDGDGTTEVARSRKLPRKVHRSFLTPKQLEKLLKGARAGGFEPTEIVVGARGEVRLLLDRDKGALVGLATNDFDLEFG